MAQLTDFLVPGIVLPYVAAAAPVGWLLCDGVALPADTPHQALRILLVEAGNPYGVDGTGNPRVPNLAGRTVVGAGAGAGLTARALGATGGAETVALTAAQLAAHSHGSGSLVTASAGDHGHGQGSLTTNSTGGHVHTSGTLSTASVAGHTHSAGTLETASAGSHDHDLYSEGASTGTTQRVNQAGNGGTANQISAVEPAGAHTHNITGSTASGGGHNHDVTGETATGGTHAHSISGTTATAGAHTHTLTGSTANTGTGEAHPNMQPFLSLTYIIKT